MQIPIGDAAHRLHRFADHFDIFGVYPGVNRLSYDLLRRIAQHAPARWAGIFDDAVRVRLADDVKHIVGEAAQLLFALVERFLSTFALQRIDERLARHPQQGTDVFLPGFFFLYTVKAQEPDQVAAV